MFGRATATRGACATATGFCATGRWLPAFAPRLTAAVGEAAAGAEGGGGGDVLGRVVGAEGGWGGGGGVLVVVAATVVGWVFVVVVVVVVVDVVVVAVTVDTTGVMTIQAVGAVPQTWPFTLFRWPPISAVEPIATIAAPATAARRCRVTHASAFLIGITSENSPEV